nr:MAG TPA: hypothetical protein [Caudoviricetes sp.]
MFISVMSTANHEQVMDISCALHRIALFPACTLPGPVVPSPVLSSPVSSAAPHRTACRQPIMDLSSSLVLRPCRHDRHRLVCTSGGGDHRHAALRSSARVVPRVALGM